MGKRNNPIEPGGETSGQLAIDGATERILDYLQNGPTDMRVGESVEKLSRTLGMKDYEVAKRIQVLHEASMIELRDPAPPATLGSYFMSSYSLWFWALLGIVFMTVLAVYAASGSLLVYSRYVLGSMFIFYLPGFALIQLLYPKKTKISQLESIILSIGASLAFVSFIMVILSYTPWEISLNPIVFLLCLLTVIFASGAVVRKFGVWR